MAPTSRLTTTFRTALLALALAMPACSEDEPPAAVPSTPPPTSAPTVTGDPPAPQPLVITTGETPYGTALVDGEGRALYVRTGDVALPCDASCLAAWPAVTAAEWTAADGLDSGLVSVVPTADGTFQLAVAGRPLHRFAGDLAPGDTYGQGFNDAWHLVSPRGNPILVTARGD